MPRLPRFFLPLVLAATAAFGGGWSSLTALMDGEIRARAWTPAPLPDPPAFAPFLPDSDTPVPFSIAVRDFTPVPGESPSARFSLVYNLPPLPCIPERLEKSGKTFLSYAGSLAFPPFPDLEWRLVSDTDASGGFCRFQIDAPDDTERFLEIDFLLGPADPAKPPRPEGRHSVGWRYHGFTPIPHPDFRPRLVFAPDPAEPRDLEPLYADGSTPCGFRARVALTPATAKFPRSAAFAFTATPIPSGAPFDRLALRINLPHAPDRLPVPQAILDGDLSGVPVFPPEDAGVRLNSDDTVTIALPPQPLALSIADGPAYALEIVRAVDALPARPPAVLLRLDSLHVQGGYDSPEGLLVSDVPATWTPWDFRAVISHPHAAATVVSTLRRHLRARGIPLLVTLPPSAPYLAWHADAVISPLP